MEYQADYKDEKLNALAMSIKSIVDSKVTHIDKTLPSQMINIGIRKLHDIARSERGKGKYLGHPLWSKNAIKILEENEGKIKGVTEYLTHEHLVPLNVVVELLIRIPLNSPVDIYKREILKLAAVAIITREEDMRFDEAKLTRKMPHNWCGTDVFARYKKVNLFDDLVEA